MTLVTLFHVTKYDAAIDNGEDIPTNKQNLGFYSPKGIAKSSLFFTIHRKITVKRETTEKPTKYSRKIY